VPNVIDLGGWFIAKNLTIDGDSTEDQWLQLVSYAPARKGMWMIWTGDISLTVPRLLVVNNFGWMNVARVEILLILSSDARVVKHPGVSSKQHNLN